MNFWELMDGLAYLGAVLFLFISPLVWMMLYLNKDVRKVNRKEEA